jgi:hypothetical protein
VGDAGNAVTEAILVESGVNEGETAGEAESA